MSVETNLAVISNAYLTMHLMAFEGLIRSDTEMQVLMMELEREMLKQEQVKTTVRHLFAPGVYMRELSIPAGTLLSGAIHKTADTMIVSKGEFLLLTDKRVAARIKAPCTFTTAIGIKRIAFFLEDSVCTTVHPTEETDIAKLEDMIIANSFEEVRGAL